MLQLMQTGGIPMWFILAFGVAALVNGVFFAMKPETGRAGIVKALTRATMFAVISGTATDLGTMFSQIMGRPEWAKSPDLHLIVMTGIGESMSPAILGGALLSLTWVVMSVGYRRGATGPQT